MSGTSTRRHFLQALGAVSLAGCASTRSAGMREPSAVGGSGQDMAPEVGPGEDLMREHGVLRRVMLVYDEAARRLAVGEDLEPKCVAGGAAIIRRVIEAYHEKLEEQQLFPRFEKAGHLVDLVGLLRAQHRAGRAVTDAVVTLSKGSLGAASERRALADALQTFNRMYRPHAAREDTILFPAFHALVGEKLYDQLGDEFEEIERKVLGEGGFEEAVADVARLEQAIGIHDLARFTPIS